MISALTLIKKVTTKIGQLLYKKQIELIGLDQMCISYIFKQAIYRGLQSYPQLSTMS